MAIEKFLFTFVKRWGYGPAFDIFSQRGNGGVEIVRDDTPDSRGQWRANVKVRVPSNGLTMNDLRDFWETTRGGASIFGVKDPLLERYFKQTDEAVGVAVAAQTDFPLDLRYVDEPTLTVEIDGAPTVAFTLEENETTPLIRFTVAPGVGKVITATYEYFIPVRAVNPVSDWRGGGLVFDEDGFELYEFFAGARYV